MASVDITGFELARRRARSAELNVPEEQLEEAEVQEEVKRRGRPPKVVETETVEQKAGE